MTSLDEQMKKGMGYGELIVDNILGLDNEYESFGEKLGKAINEDEIGFLKNAAVGIYEGAKEFVTSPIETTKEVITDIKDSVQRLGSEDLDTRLQSMYGVSYDQATDQQVTSAKEAVIGDAMTALELIPAAKATTVTAKAASSAIPSGVKADIVGQTKAVFGGDMEFLKGTPTERSGTVGVGAQRVDNPTIQFETSSGSTYDQFENATTIRNRAERDDNEVSGVQPRSGKTVFMDKESIDTIGPLFQNTEIPVQFIPLEGNKAKLIYTEDYGPKKAGEDASNVVQFTTSPRMGLHPVEIMDSKNTDRRNIHFGNEIVKIKPLSNTPLTKSKKQTNPLVRSVNASNVEVQADLADFRSSVLGSLDNLAIGKDGMSGFQIKKFLEKRAPKINKTELYWSGLLENLDDNKKYSKQELKTLADRNVPYTHIEVLDGLQTRYSDVQRVALNINGFMVEPLDNYKEILITNQNTKGTEYGASHFAGVFEPDTNILAHVRGAIVDNNHPDLPVKEKFFLVEELQSDAVQQHTVADKAIAKKIKEQETSKPTLGDIGLHYQTEFNDMIFPYHMGGLEFTDKFVKDIDSYNYNFRSIGDQDTAEQAIQLGLTNIIDDMAKLKSRFLDGNTSKDAIVSQLSQKYGLKERSITRRSIQELDEVDNIFANVLGDYVFGKTAVRKFNKENNNEFKEDLINIFKGININTGIEKDLVPAKLSDTIRMSLLAVIKESKNEGVNKIYIPTPKVISKAHDLSLEAAKNTYSDGVRKVLRTLNNETNGKIKFKNKNPEGISYYEDKDSVGIEIDITDFDLPDNPQFRFNRGGLAATQTEQMMGMPTAGDPAIIDPTTGQPYSPAASMRQQEEITRQAEAKEEFNTLKLPENIQEEVEEQIRPMARPEGLPNVYESKTAVDKVLDLGFLLKQKQKDSRGLSKVVSGLDENNPVHQKTIKGFFDNAVGGDTGFDPTKEAWCAAFVNHVLTELGADLIDSKDPYDKIRANKYKEYGEPVELENIQEGDIVVFDFDKDGTADHVTFYAGSRVTDQGQGQYINVIGGNQGGKVSIRENHPYYVLDNVAAIRRVTYDGDAYKIAQSHKDSDPIFKTFLPEEHEDYALNLQGSYNKGGMTMDGQMKMAFMQEGGLKDDGMKQDPVSGNPIPNGSMAKEVRDDIPAQLSEGEYVVPADVVRYLGVKHFEDLRNKAKEGLQSMEANGRIGGEPVPVGGPKAAPMMQQQMQPPMPQAPTPYSPAPTPPQPQQMAMGGDLSPEEMQEINSIMMAQGGMVPTDPYQQQQTQYQQPMAAGAANGTDMSPYNSNFSFYNPPGMSSKEAISTPNVYSPNFSWETPAGGTAISTTESEVPVESEETCKARGLVYNPDTKMCEVPLPTVSTRDDTGPSISDEQDKPADPNAWIKDYNYNSDQSLYASSISALESPKIGSIEALVNKVFGGTVLGTLGKAGTAAQIAANIKILESQGSTELASNLQEQLNGYITQNNLEWIPSFMIDGDQLAAGAEGVLKADPTSLFNVGASYRTPTAEQIKRSTGRDVTGGGLEEAKKIIEKTKKEGPTEKQKEASERVKKALEGSKSTEEILKPSRKERDRRESAAERIARDTSAARERSKKAEKKYGKATGGRATGGLVSRPKKK